MVTAISFLTTSVRKKDQKEIYQMLDTELVKQGEG